MRRNWFIQFIYIALATFLIWWVVFNLNYQIFKIEVPIKIINLEEGLAVNNHITTINTTIRTRRANLARINKTGEIEAQLDLGDIVSVGIYKIPIQVIYDNKIIDLITYSPRFMDIEIVSAKTINIELIPDTVGFPPAGFSLGEIKLSPTTVTAKGPSNLLDSNAKAFVKIDINDRQKSFSISIQPEVRDALGNKLMNFSFTPSNVTADIEIKEGDNLATLGLEPVFTGQLSSGYWISNIIFEPPAVTIRGNIKNLEGLEYLLTSPINLNNKTDSFSDKVSIELPQGISLLGPNIVSVMVNLRTASNSRQLILLPSYTNITDGFSVTLVSPATVTLNLSGPSDKLDQLNRFNTLLDLDLRGSLSGINLIELNTQMFTVPDGVEVSSFKPQTLEVTLTKNN